MDKYTREFFSEEAYYEIQEQHMPFTIIEKLCMVVGTLILLWVAVFGIDFECHTYRIVLPDILVVPLTLIMMIWIIKTCVEYVCCRRQETTNCTFGGKAMFPRYEFKHGIFGNGFYKWSKLFGRKSSKVNKSFGDFRSLQAPEWREPKEKEMISEIKGIISEMMTNEVGPITFEEEYERTEKDEVLQIRYDYFINKMKNLSL